MREGAMSMQSYERPSVMDRRAKPGTRTAFGINFLEF
jgi:hypothetical protein